MLRCNQATITTISSSLEARDSAMLLPISAQGRTFVSSHLVTLKREPSKNEGTFGVLTLEDGQQLLTLECPWLNNKRRVSCIPNGLYEVTPHVSPKFGKCFWVKDVPDRSEILFHVGNWAGNVEMGYRSDSLGCILLGTNQAVIKGQLGISNSKIAVQRMLTAVKEPFLLLIEG